MKQKRLSDYLALMKAAQDDKKYPEVKRLGETALKKFPNLAGAAPMEKYLLYHRLGNAYFQIQQYSVSLDMFHKTYLVAAKYRLKPEYQASAAYMLGANFTSLRNYNLALRQYQKAEQYYRQYGFKKPPMGLPQYASLLQSTAYCYLNQDDQEKARAIIEEKLPPYESMFTGRNLVDYYYLKSYYFIRRRDYSAARQTIEKSVQAAAGDVRLTAERLKSRISLAVLTILEGQPGSAINLLKSILQEAGRARYPGAVCESLLLLNKCYTLIGLADKAAAAEKRLSSFLNKIDLRWFYELSKDVERLYEQLEKEQNEIPARSAGITGRGGDGPMARFREQINGRLSSYSVWGGEAGYPGKEDKQYALVGKSPAMKEVYELIEKVAPTDLPILIYGETGTGKELVARSIHQKSLRSRGTWLACNTGAIPETLLESELFGYVKGAFSGAQADKKGYIELASGGTLFLDEIGNMSLGMQQKLLRVMEDSLLWRVGAEKPVQVNTRFVFASNEDLEEPVRQKRFREDLWYRINTIIITLPALRKRKEDIPLLIQHFFNKYAGKNISFRPDIHRDSALLRILTDYPWPGNVRELENEIKRILVLHPQAKEITGEMLSEAIRGYQPSLFPEISATGRPAAQTGQKTLAHLTEIFQKNLIQQTIAACNGNLSRAARQLGYDRRNLYRKMKQLKMPLS